MPDLVMSEFTRLPESEASMSKKPMPDVHPYAAFFPLDEGPNLWELANDIKENGLLEPIWLLEGMILDGRRRYLGCERVGVEPSYQEYQGDDPLGFVVSKNLHRRHLGTGDRALIAAKIAGMKQGGTEKPPSAPKGAIRDNSVSQEKAAELLNVSRNSVQRASQVLESGTPELIAAVTAGEVTVSDAAAIVSEPAKVQNAAVKAKRSGKTKTVKAAVLPPPAFGDAAEPTPEEIAAAEKNVSKAANAERDRLGNEVPKSLRDIFGDGFIAEAIAQVKNIHKVFRSGQKAFPYLHDKVLFDLCDALVAKLEYGRPWVVCKECKGKGCKHCRTVGYVSRGLFEEQKHYGEAS